MDISSAFQDSKVYLSIQLNCMPAKKHFLSEIDEDRRTAVCSFCGPVNLIKHRGGWKCNIITDDSRKRHREYSKKYRDSHPEKMYAKSWDQWKKRQAKIEKSSKLCACGCGQYTLLARYTNKQQGIRIGEPLRYLKGHNRPKTLKGDKNSNYICERYSIEDRGYDTPCWIWKLAYGRGGYSKCGNTSAHRVYYEKFKGKIPDRYHVDHLCHVKACINPEHLEAVTPQENEWRAYATRLGLSKEQRESLSIWLQENLTDKQLQKNIIGWLK